MVDALRKKLWEAMYLNPLWPSELIENAMDPDYSQVKFSKWENGTKAELVFIDEGEEITTTYLFDEKEFLQSAIMTEFGRETVIYDRAREVAAVMKNVVDAVTEEMLMKNQSA
ncbi:hypothetical protein ABEO98_22520 [Brevibacillus parabrevis]|jgi:hypothetical protein|uniref:hypothetical protein n=1 Tax=Brevibacillus parabrevis TaxID=54914 RepID=UPI00248FD2B5|nr:hypothetical protein [Brevibacillus parabrevis]